MDLNNPQNQSYWFVVREDQSNVIFSTNNVIQNTQIAGQETRFIVDTGDNHQYIQIHKPEVIEQEETPSTVDVDNFWDQNKVQLLLSLWRDDRFKDTYNKTMWDQVSAIVGINQTECIRKYKSLRRTYVRLLKKRRSGESIKWIHYNMCDEVFKDCKSLSQSTLVPWEDKKVRKLLALYIENLHRFRDRDSVQRDIWKEIASALNTSEYNCYQKFKNLKRRYFAWLDKKRNTGRQIKWPYLQYFERIFYNHDPYIYPWDGNKIKQLIDAYSQIAYKFRSSSFRKKELWKEIGAIVGKKASDCDRKFRNLKQTYIRLKMRADTGRPVTKWKYYKDFETLYNNMKVNRNGTPFNNRYIEDYVVQMLLFIIDNIEKFKYPLRKRKHFWRLIGLKLGLTAEACDRKFRNLKQTFIRLHQQKSETGQCIKWPYYSYFEKIYEGCSQQPINKTGDDITRDVDSHTIAEIRKVMRGIQDRHNGEKFDKLIQAMQDSNDIQRERNMILKALLERR